MGTQARSPVLAALAITLVTVLSCGTCPPARSLLRSRPAAQPSEANQFLLTVNGNGFRRGSVVGFNGSFRVTTFISSNEVVATITITATDIAQPGTLLVFVFNPPECGTTFVSRWDRSDVHNLV